MEKLLRENDRIFRNAFEHAAIGMIMADIHGKILNVNQWFCDYLGYSREEMINLGFQDLTHPDDLSKDENHMKMLRAGEISSFQMEKRYMHKNGHIVWGLLNVSLVTYGPENFTYVFGQIQDITERKVAEEGRRQSEERFAKAFTASPSALAILSLVDGQIIDLNYSMEMVLGYERYETLGKTIDDLNLWVTMEERHLISSTFVKQGYARGMQTRLRNKRGEIIIGLVSMEPITLEEKVCVLATFQDITAQLAMEKEMFRLESLNLIGEMAASVGHEIRNPMTTVRGFLQMFGEKPEYQKHREIFDLMVEELDRANSIIVEFLSLNRDKRVNFEKVNLNRILENLSPLIKADALKMNLEVEFHLQDLDEIMVDVKEIRQLVLNLARNGLEAMTNDGKLTLQTYQMDSEVVLRVRDQGPGISEEVVDQLGRPFITTKEMGTGLGLAVCYSVAHRNHAIIRFETGDGGTTFEVAFKVGA